MHIQKGAPATHRRFAHETF